MCGILGIIPPIQKDLFKQALDTLTHRGPDDYGIYIDQDIALGHRRLSIIDLSSNGHQPMGYGKVNHDNDRYQIIFNGEIYNYVEIRDELIAKGYVFHTQSDTEVILASYDCWGTKCLNRFNGMWAFAIWDNKEKKLFLSRDRFGKKPLFYAFSRNSKGEEHFIFASEMKAIYPFLKEIKPSENFSYLSSQKNIFSCGQTHDTIVKNIFRFPKSHYTILNLKSIANNKAIKFHRYYNILDNLSNPIPTYDDAVKKFKELFYDAVKIRLRSDVPIGITLSGGVDSSSVASTASQLTHSQNIHAFVACFDNTPQDERYYAQKVAEFSGIDTSYLNINPLSEWGNLEHYFYMLEELYGRCPIAHIATYQAVRDNKIKVTLDGHGSDEMLCGYGEQVEQALWSCGLNHKKIADVLFIANGIRKTPYGVGKLLKHTGIIYTKKFIKKILGKRSIFEISQDMQHHGYQKLDSLSQMLYSLFYERLLPINIRDYDKYSMINSIEMRMPFMDYRIVEFFFSQPFHYKNRDGFTKKIVRDAMQNIMPKDVTYRKSKIGFNAPMIDWIKRKREQNGLHEWFDDILHSKDFLECNLVPNHISAIKAFDEIVKHQTPSPHLAETIWCNLNPYLWQTSNRKYALKFKEW